jgi:hypothetical protein
MIIYNQFNIMKNSTFFSKSIILVCLFFLFSFVANAQNKVTCVEKEEKIEDNSEPRIISTCTWGNYKIVKVGEADFKGRYNYQTTLYKLVNGQYQVIQNEDLFNQKKAQLLANINQKISVDYAALVKDKNNRDCLGNRKTAPKLKFNDMQIDFTEKGFDFNISYGMPGACLAIDGTILSYKFEVLKQYLQP